MSNKCISIISFWGLLVFILSYSAQAQSGYQTYIGLDLLPGEDVVSQRLTVISRYQVSPQFSAGLGTGFTYYNDPLSHIPVFANLNYNLTRTNLAPFLFLNTGYNASILTDTNTEVDSHRGGWMLNPGAGLRFDPENGPGWHLNVGYSIDHSQFERQEWMNRTTQTDITYKRLMIGLGLSF